MVIKGESSIINNKMLVTLIYNSKCGNPTYGVLNGYLMFSTKPEKQAGAYKCYCSPEVKG